MTARIEYRDATPNDAADIARQVIASRDKQRDDDMSFEAIAERFRGYMNRTHHPQKAEDPRVVYLALEDSQVIGHVACHHSTRNGLEAELQSGRRLKLSFDPNPSSYVSRAKCR